MGDLVHRAWTGKAIMHVDMDAFFAAVEQLDHPEWRGVPVIVGGSPDGRGVVSTASYEARAFGVRSAMPSAQAVRLCPGAIWAPARFDRYHEVSARVFDILRGVTPRVQPVSIDEAYADVSPGAHGEHPVALARRVLAEVAALGVTCSIGVGASRTVAKIASDHDKPHGLTVVWPGEESEFLAPLPVRALPGVGGTTESVLRSVGVRTLGELASMQETSARHLLGSQGVDLILRASGVDSSAVDEGPGRKSISAEHTFSSDIRERRQVEAELRKLVGRVAVRLRRKGLAGRTVTMKLRYADFTTRTAQRTLGVASDLESELEAAAFGLLDQTWTPGAGLRLLGFGISGLTFPERQLDLLAEDPAADERGRRRKALADSVEVLRERFGPRAIGYGERGIVREDEEDG